MLAYIQKSVRVDGYPRTVTVKCLGLLSDIQKEHGCADPRKWVEDLAAAMTAEEKESRKKVTLELSPSKAIDMGERPLRHGGDLMLLGLYNKLGMPKVCSSIIKGCRAKYDLNGILQTLVTSRILFPCSKRRTMELAKGFVKLGNRKNRLDHRENDSRAIYCRVCQLLSDSNNMRQTVP